MSDVFTGPMKRYFGADRGAFSVVTNDENSKSQITFVGPEQELAESHFGDKLDKRHGSIATIEALGIDPELEYRLFPSGRRVRLTTSYKTNKPRELRFYLRTDEFKPFAGWYWGVFEKSGEIWLCQFSEDNLGKINDGSLSLDSREGNLEPDEDGFQLELNGGLAPKKSRTVSYKYGRSSAVAFNALENANFTCELFPEYPNFQALRGGHAFMEAHHLIPMKMQEQFEANLDIVANVCCLNPLSHRMVHHGRFSDFEANLTRIVLQRAEFIRSVGWIEDDVLGLYAVS